MGKLGQIKAFLLTIQRQSTGYSCMMEHVHFDTFADCTQCSILRAGRDRQAAEHGLQEMTI